MLINKGSFLRNDIPKVTKVKTCMRHYLKIFSIGDGSLLTIMVYQGSGFGNRFGMWIGDYIQPDYWPFIPNMLFVSNFKLIVNY